MAVAQHERSRQAGASVVMPNAPAAASAPHATGGEHTVAPATAATPLASTLARAVRDRPPAPSWQHPTAPVLQREVVHEDDWFGSAYDAVGELIGVAANRVEDAVSSVVSAVGQRVEESADFVLDKISGVAGGIRESPAPPAVKAEVVAKLITYPEAVAGSFADPDAQGWLENAGLNAVRGGTLLLRRGGSANDPGALSLMKQALQAWGSDRLGLDILPTGGTGGPFGPETEAAVKKFQLCSGAAADGIVGPQTMKRLDDFVLG